MPRGAARGDVMQAPYFLVRDDVAADVVARLGARDVALWIRSPLEYGASVDNLARFAGLPWAMVIDERYDKALVDAIQQAEAVDDPLVRRRGFIQVIERSEEHTSELQSLMRISYAVFCLKKKKRT